MKIAKKIFRIYIFLPHHKKCKQITIASKVLNISPNSVKLVSEVCQFFKKLNILFRSILNLILSIEVDFIFFTLVITPSNR